MYVYYVSLFEKTEEKELSANFKRLDRNDINDNLHFTPVEDEMFQIDIL